MRKIVVNMLGGDLPLEEIIKGVNNAKVDEGYSLVLVGPKDILANQITKNVEIIDATYDIKSDTNPTDMMSKYTDCALMKSYKYLKENEDAAGLVTMSGTGCVFVGALFILGLIPGIKSAVLACNLYNKAYEYMCVLDIGANLDSNANQLLDYARIGNAFMKSYFNIENPRIGLINLGSEPKKGTKTLKATFELLENSNMNFIGNVEFSNVFEPTHDVLVCDGLVGNAVLKNSESVANVIIDVIKSQDIDSNIKDDLISKIKALYDYNNLAGSFLCGVNKVVVKAHGNCNSKTIDATINQAINLDKGDFINNLQKEFKNE